MWALLTFTVLPCTVKFFPGIAVWDWLPGILLPPRADSLTWCLDTEPLGPGWSLAVQGSTWAVEEKQDWNAGSLASKLCKCFSLVNYATVPLLCLTVPRKPEGPSSLQWGPGTFPDPTLFPPCKHGCCPNSAHPECPFSHLRICF